MAAETGKMSFAKVAASATKKVVPAGGLSLRNTAGIVDGSSSKNRYDKLQTAADIVASAKLGSSSPVATKATHKGNTNGVQRAEVVPQRLNQDGAEISTTRDATDAAAIGIQTLMIAAEMPGLVLNDTAMDAVAASPARKLSDPSTSKTASSDDASQKVDSNSELGTKPPSLDGKSVTSGTTFNALDEKESLRPDDSASVKAAADEDDTFSIRGSLLVNSRLGSDVAPRIQRIQIGDMPPRIVQIASKEPVTLCVATPHGASSDQQPVTEARVQLATSTATPAGVNVQNPDEKLLDAMQSQKDRIFLLRLENEVVNFVQNSKEPFMDLPPSNSYCRMLTHKLADYYHMTHSFEAVASAVRIYRTPFCRVPPPLASFVAANAPSSSTPPPPVVQPKKIMRRGEECEIPTSSGPSKPTSEAGSDSKDKAPPTKEKMSREEREEAYIKARERIFGMAAGATTPENDDSNGISRASSVSAKDRGSQGKKGKPGKQRRDDSESFDSRSQYTPFYHHPQQATWVPPHFVPVSSAQFNGAPMPMHQPLHSSPAHQPPLPPAPPQQQHPQLQQPPSIQPQPPHFANVMQPPIAYGATQPPYSPAMPNNGLVAPNGGIPTAPRHPAQGAPPAYAYSPSGQLANGGPPHHWQHQQPQKQQQPSPQQAPPYNNGAFPPAQGRPGPPLGPSPPAGPAHVGMSYAFGQLPSSFNPGDPKSQHPIPGSYAGTYGRHGFNPKTQSFVPGTGPMAIPMPGPQAPYAMGSGPMQMGMGAAGPLVGHQPGPGPAPPGGMPFGNGSYQQPMLSTSPYSGSTTSSFGMMRQDSGSSTSGYPMGPRAGPMGYHEQPYGGMPHGGQPHPAGPQGPAPHGPHPYGHPHLPPHGPTNGPPSGPHHNVPRGPSHHHNKQGIQHPPHGPKKQSVPPGPKGLGASYSNLPHYGNPATLPQKPGTK